MADKNDLRRWARIALDGAGGNWEAAARNFRRAIDGNAQLRADLLEPFIDAAIWNLIRECARQDRRSYESSNRVGRDNPRGLELMSLLNFPLQGGLRLGQARQAEVVDMAELYDQNARGNAINAHWLHAIARRLPDEKKKVSDVLTEEKVAGLRQKAEKAMG